MGNQPEESREVPGVEVIPFERMTILPPPPGKCQVCAVEHGPDDPHDAQSLYYQMAFRQQHARWPTWADALAHCPPEVRAFWQEELRLAGVSESAPAARRWRGRSRIWRRSRVCTPRRPPSP